MDRIKIAIIGCGRFSQFFVPLFQTHPVVDEVYVCDLKRERAEEFSQRFGVKIIDSFEEALASDQINCIAVFTQRFNHGQMVIQSLKAGKHVYSAVPCAVSIEASAGECESLSCGGDQETVTYQYLAGGEV